MKAWKVFIPDEWCTLMHADTRGQAIEEARKWVNDFNEFTQFRAHRLPGLDGKPITWKNAFDAGFEYYDDNTGDTILEDQFINDCHCGICIP